MINIDYNFLDELGLGAVDSQEKDLMIADIKAALQSRLGEAVEQKLDDQKAEELANLSEEKPETVEAWLQTNLPDYQQIIEQEIQKIKTEIKPQVAGITGQSAPA